MTNSIIDFYSHNGTDNLGRTLKEIWSWNNTKLDKTHDYIQWLFPTSQPSQFNPHAPIVDEETIKAFKNSHELQSYLITSSFLFERFLDLGNPDTHWLTNNNHNFLRITRVIDSLMTLYCRPRAHQFYARVEKAYSESKVCPISFWRNATLTQK